MKLPNVDRARVEREKLVDYLLDLEHVDGGPKARFSWNLASLSHWRLLHVALLSHAREIEVTGSGSSPRGIYHVLEGAMQMADGREAFLRTAWQIRWGDIEPGLVIACPRAQEDKMIPLYKSCVLVVDLPAQDELLDRDLRVGDRGAVIEIYENGAAYAVESLKRTAAQLASHG